MIKAGDIALKLAGRDAGEICVVLDVLDNNLVLIEGNTRRRKCNLRHLEFIGKEIEVNKDTTREGVLKSLKNLGLGFKEIKKGSKKEKVFKGRPKRKVVDKKAVDKREVKKETEIRK